MKLSLCRSIVFINVCLLSLIAGAQPSSLLHKPNDAFSTSFLKIYKASKKGFTGLKGKPIDKSPGFFYTKLSLPGSAKSGFICMSDSPYCQYYIDSFLKRSEAEAAFIDLNSRIAEAFNDKVRVKYLDPVDTSTLQSSKIARLKTFGFFDYDISVELKQKSQPVRSYYLSIRIFALPLRFYHTIPSNQPIASLPFLLTVKRFEGTLAHNKKYDCENVLNGYHCQLVDTAMDNAVVMQKYLKEEPHSVVEFETAVSNLISALGENYVYYLPGPAGSVQRHVIFIKANDTELRDRSSISVKLINENDDQFILQLTWYTPVF